MDTDELGPVSQRRAAFGESLMKIETAFTYYQTAIDDDEDRADAIDQYRRFDEVYRLLETEYVAINTALKDVFETAKEEKRKIPYTWTRYRTELMAADREIQIDKLLAARLGFIEKQVAVLEAPEPELPEQD